LGLRVRSFRDLRVGVTAYIFVVRLGTYTNLLPASSRELAEFSIGVCVTTTAARNPVIFLLSVTFLPSTFLAFAKSNVLDHQVPD
jgi:hypothetical protein